MKWRKMTGGFPNKKSFGRKYAIFGAFRKVLKAKHLPNKGVVHRLEMWHFNIISDTSAPDKCTLRGEWMRHPSPINATEKMLNGCFRPKKPDFPRILMHKINSNHSISRFFPSMILSIFFIDINVRKACLEGVAHDGFASSIHDMIVGYYNVGKPLFL
ncbi:MAG: hypothetical protein IJK87_05075 [Prevotella sp.]|nr:hypothetical protein [Prevotella sp.]